MSIFQKAAAILIGSLLFGIGINGFLVPHHLLDGGTTGIALILHYYFGLPTGLMMVLLSIPLLIYAWFYEKGFFYRSITGVIVSSFMIDWLSPLRNEFSFSVLTSAILGGMLIGIGIGIMLRYKANTGGTDLFAQLISNAFPVNIGAVIVLIDGLIVTVAYKILGFKEFLFSCLVIGIVGIITSTLDKQSRYMRWY